MYKELKPQYIGKGKLAVVGCSWFMVVVYVVYGSNIDGIATKFANVLVECKVRNMKSNNNKAMVYAVFRRFQKMNKILDKAYAHPRKHQMARKKALKVERPVPVTHKLRYHHDALHRTLHPH